LLNGPTNTGGQNGYNVTMHAECHGILNTVCLRQPYYSML
jgi:hypothetical protein